MPAKLSASGNLPLPREIFVHGNEKFLNALLDRLRHRGLDHFGIFAGISRGQRYLRRHDVGELRDRLFSQRLRCLSSAGVDGGQAVRIVVQPIDSLLSLSWPRRLSGRPFPVWHSEAVRLATYSANQRIARRPPSWRKLRCWRVSALKGGGRSQKAKRADPFPPKVCVVSISDHF